MSGRPMAALSAARTASNDLDDVMLRRSISTLLTIMFFPFYLRELPEAGQPQFMTIERPDVLDLAQPLNQELVQPVGRVQWNPVAGGIDLLVAPGAFHELSRHFHAFAVEVVII